MWNYLKYEITVILRNINFEIYAVNLNTYSGACSVSARILD